MNESFLHFSFNDTATANITEKKIIWIVIDNKLNLKCLLKYRCKKANQKLSALSRINQREIGKIAEVNTHLF